MFKISFFSILIFIGLFFPVVLLAGELKIAVASNFSKTAEVLAEQFENQFSHTVSLSRSSSGKHYAQIKNGAPFDVFLAADSGWPKRLENEGLTIAGSRFTYAIGKIVMWGSNQSYSGSGDQVLQLADYRYVAIANPRLAPYGLAAKEALTNLGLWQGMEDKLVTGENIGQALLFVQSGHAELGFIAASQLKQLLDHAKGYVWRVPESLYTPLRQQAVLLKSSLAGKEFMRYLASDEARAIIQNHGYDLVHAQ